MDWFLPNSIDKNQHLLSRAKITIRILLFSSITCMILCLYSTIVDVNTTFPYIPFSLICFTLLILLKYTGAIRIVGHCIVGVTALVLFYMSLRTGGIYSADTALLYLVPLLAFTTVGFKDGLFWMSGCIVWVFYLNGLANSPEQIQYFRDQTMGFDSNYYMLLCLINIIVIFSVFFIFQFQNKKMIRELENKKMELERRNNEYAQQKVALENTKKKLELSNKELQQYAHVTSHDLKQPIRTINGFTSLLNRHLTKNNLVDEKSSELVKMIISGTNNMLRFVEDLLAYAKLTATEEPSFEKMDLDEVLDNVLFDLKNQIEENNVTIERKDLPFVKVVPVKINQIFQNIISNAIKFKKKNENLIIRISSEKKGSHWQLVIEDNGIGIEEEYQEQIFAPFQKLHNEEEYSGSGIGLATCKRIVDLHQGEIWVESEIDEGTKFYFTLAEGECN